MFTTETVRKPSSAHVRALTADLLETQRRRAAQEDAAILARGRVPLARTLPLRDGRDDFGRLECFVPKGRYWRLRKKYGRGLFTSDAGLKDLRRHHPEWFTQTVSHRPTFGLNAAGRNNYEAIFGHD